MGEMIPSKEPHPTGKGPNNGPWVATKEDPLCKCGEPKHTHMAGVGPSTENATCPGFYPQEGAAVPPAEVPPAA